MNNALSSPEIIQKSYARLWSERKPLAPVAGVLAGLFLLANLARAIFPGVYVFNPFDQGWLLMPEAIMLGPVLALIHHRLLSTGTAFGWSRENRLIKFGKAAAYYYGLLLLFKIGLFISTKGLPALLGFVLGPTLGSLAPLVIIAGVIFFLLVYVRLILVYAVLAGESEEPLMESLRLTKDHSREIASCLLLLAAPVLIPWIAASVYGDGWMNPSHGTNIQILPILIRTLLQTMGALLLSSGLCILFEARTAQEARLEEARALRDETDHHE